MTKVLYLEEEQGSEWQYMKRDHITTQNRHLSHRVSRYMNKKLIIQKKKILKASHHL